MSWRSDWIYIDWIWEMEFGSMSCDMELSKMNSGDGMMKKCEFMKI